jgi:RES domain-containing protein
MKVYRITRCDFIRDLSGNGAAINGGRWNSMGVYVLYTASSASLALLETLAHLRVMPETGFCIACLNIPDESLFEVKDHQLPENWNRYPAPLALQQIGDTFIKEHKYLAIQFPSALLKEDKVILLNPNHKEFKKVRVEYIRNLDIDKRLHK